MTEHSDSLRKDTLKTLQEPPVTADGKLHMKHSSEGYGYFDLLDLAAFKFVLYRKGNEAQVIFADEQAVVATGWAID